MSGTRLPRARTLLGALGMGALTLLLVAGVFVAYALLVPVDRRRPRWREALDGCRAAKQAAEIALAMDDHRARCPSVAELVSSHRLPRERASDPWGTPYMVVCEDDEARVISAGGDRVAGTEDDLRDNLGPAEVERVERLYAERARHEERDGSAR